MENIEEFKKNWLENKANTSQAESFDHLSWQKVLKLKANQQKHISMQYFWASFTLQLIVYAFLSHIIVRYWADSPMLYISLFCLLLYVPFTVVLMRKFKRLAVLKTDEKHVLGLPIHEYIRQQYTLLASFYRFKKGYETMLVPLSSAVLIWVIFRLYVPGGISAYPIAASVCLLLTIGACAMAILAENKKNFKQPLTRLRDILQDFEQ